MIPERAYGTTAGATASQRVAPSASAASRWLLRHGQQHLPRHRHDERHDHDRQDDAGREHRGAVDRALEDRQEAQRLAQEGEDAGLEHRDQDEDAPEAVDHARNRGEQLDQRWRPASRIRSGANSVRIDRHAEGERHGEQQREERGEQRPEDQREGAELLGDRVPDVLVRKPKPNFEIAACEPWASSRTRATSSAGMTSAATSAARRASRHARPRVAMPAPGGTEAAARSVRRGRSSRGRG